jgi:hypothetical protein
MIKNVAYFPLQCALNSRPVMASILDGLNTNGIVAQENSMSSDAAIIWSVLWNGRMQHNQSVYRHYRQQGKPVIIVEIGALHRGLTWKISVNNVTAQGYYGHLDQLDWDRPKKLNVELTMSKPRRNEIVIALQHTKSLQVESIPDMTQWLATTVQLIKNNTDRTVIVRPHPRCKIVIPSGIKIETPSPVPGTYDSFDMHYDCHAVVNYNSGPGIQAAIAGVRPVVDVSSLAYPVSTGFADIEQPYVVDRELWLRQICHTEYTIEELKQGLWLNRIRPALLV